MSPTERATWRRIGPSGSSITACTPPRILRIGHDGWFRRQAHPEPGPAGRRGRLVVAVVAILNPGTGKQGGDATIDRADRVFEVHS